VGQWQSLAKSVNRHNKDHYTTPTCFILLMAFYSTLIAGQKKKDEKKIPNNENENGKMKRN